MLHFIIFYDILSFFNHQIKRTQVIKEPGGLHKIFQVRMETFETLRHHPSTHHLLTKKQGQ